MEFSIFLVKGVAMVISSLPFTVTEWDSVPDEEHPGETGTSRWKTIEANGIRIRMVEYSAGFRSDHWCPRGHVLLVLEGELEIRLKDGSHHKLKAGTGFHTGDDPDNPHLARTENAARVFIVD